MSAPNFAKRKRMEQAEDSSPDPSSSACEIQNQPRFCGNHSPRKLLPQNRVRIVPPPARILGGQNTKEKCPFHFQEKFHPRQIKKARDIFLWGCRGSARQWRNDTSVRFSFKPPRTRGVRISPFAVRKRFEQSRVIQHNS